MKVLLDNSISILSSGEVSHEEFFENILNIYDWLTATSVSEKAKMNILAALRLRDIMIEHEFSSGITFSDSKKVSKLLLEDLRFDEREHFICIYLSSSMSLIKKEIISIGSVDTIYVSPRDVFRPAISYNATYIVVAHNHPRGEAVAGELDIKLTRRLVEIGCLIGTYVIDHIIVGGNDYCSLYDNDPALFQHTRTDKL